MNKFASTGGALALCLMSAACATHSTARMEARGALANPTDKPRAETAAASSYFWGDRWTAANLYERAQTRSQDSAHRSNLINRFNLAATYQNTGRTAEAAELYRAVAADGAFIHAVGVTTNADRTQRVRSFNLAREASARLATMSWRTADRPTPARLASGTARSADTLGVPASAVVGARTQGRVSDATAIQRDATAQPPH